MDMNENQIFYKYRKIEKADRQIKETGLDQEIDPEILADLEQYRI